MLARQRLEQLDRRRAAGQRGAAGLIRQRDRDVGVGVADQRLDEVELRGRQVVEPVQQQRPAVPGFAQRVQRGARQAVGVDGAERLQPAVVGRIQRGELARVRRRRAGLAPGAHGRAEPPRRRQRPLQLGEEVPERVGEARALGGGGERVQLGLADRRPHDAVARQPPQRPPAHAGRARDVAHQPREGRHVGAEDHARPGELAGVVGGVGRGRDDQHRVARERGAQAVEHRAGLGGVRGSGDQRQGHGDHIGSRAGRPE